MIDFLYPVMLLLSFAFLLVTTCVYIIIRDLRKQLFGKMMLGFLINVSLNFLLNGINQVIPLSDYDVSITPGCFILAYLTHYTFISFFLWMNAMAVNVTYKFRDILQTHNLEERSSSLVVTMILVYTQGIPAVISIIIAIIDTTADCAGDTVLPNMARFNCFLATDHHYYDDGDESVLNKFLHSSEFLYFYLIIFIIVMVNTVLFIIAGYFILRQMYSQDDILQRR